MNNLNKKYTIENIVYDGFFNYVEKNEKKYKVLYKKGMKKFDINDDHKINIIKENDKEYATLSINLNKLDKRFMIYTPGGFPGAKLKINLYNEDKKDDYVLAEFFKSKKNKKEKKRQATVLFYSAGKHIITGLKNKEDIEIAKRKLTNFLNENGIKVSEPEEKIVNMVALHDIKSNIHLTKALHNLDNAIYTPEGFPGLSYSHTKDIILSEKSQEKILHKMPKNFDKCNILMFMSGMISINKINTEDYIDFIIESITLLLEDKDILFIKNDDMLGSDIELDLDKLLDL